MGYDCNEERAKAILERFGFNFNPEYRNEIRQLLQDEYDCYKKDKHYRERDSSEYLRVLCGYLFCIGNPEDLELIEKVKYGISMDVGSMVDGAWVDSLSGLSDTNEREELINEFISYYKHYFSL